MPVNPNFYYLFYDLSLMYYNKVNNLCHCNDQQLLCFTLLILLFFYEANSTESEVVTFFLLFSNLNFRIYGSLMKRMQPNRDSKSVHFVSERDWPWMFFPPFVQEPTFLISSDLVPRLLLAASTLDLLPLEQVSLSIR